MKDTRAWRVEPTKSLQKLNLPKDQVEALLDVELCLFAIEKLGLQSELDTAATLWLLISNRFFLFPNPISPTWQRLHFYIRSNRL